MESISNTENINDVIRSTYDSNPHNRLLITTTNLTDNELEIIFIETWKTYQMLDILFLSKNIDDTFLYAYNPFDLNSPKKFLKIYIDQKNSIDPAMERVMKFSQNRLRNLNGYPIRIAIFEDVGISKLIEEHGGYKRYKYQDGEVAYLLSKVINFYPNYTTNPDNARFGGHGADDSFSGAMEDLYLGNAEVAVNARIITNVHRADFFTFLNWCTTLNLIFVTPARYYTYQFTVFPHSSYDDGILCLMLFTFIAIVISYYIANYFDHHWFKRDVKQYSFVRIILNVTSLMWNIQLMEFPGSQQLKQCIIMGSFLLITLNINSCYQGNIITELNASPDAGEIDTLQQLLDTKLEIYIESFLPAFLSPYKDFSNESIYKQLYDRQRYEIDTFSQQLIVTSKNRTSAFLTPEIYLANYQAETFENGEVQIHGVRESLMNFYLGITISKKSPYIHRFNEVVDLIVAAGVVNYQTDRAMSEARLEYIKKIKQYGVKDENLKLIGMKQLKSIFLFYCCMCALALNMFLFEHLMNKLAKYCWIVKQVETFLESNTV